MKYLYSKEQYKKINESWFDDKLKSMSDPLNNIFTQYLKPFTKIFPIIYNVDKILTGEDIKINIEETIKKSFDSLLKELPKCNTPEELNPDLWDFLSQFNINIKNSINIELSKKFEDNINLDSYKSVISNIFNTINTISNSLKKDYVDALNKVDDMKEKEKIASEKIDNLFKVFKSEIDAEDWNEIFDKREYVGDFSIGDIIKYKIDGYDDTKKEEEQSNYIETGSIKKVDKDTIIIINDLNKEITIDIKNVLGKEDVKKSQTDLKSELGKIKEDEFKLNKVLNFVKKINNE